jgi:UDP-glucose 4-epimerase
MEFKVVGITGGSGFLGSALAVRLAQRYHVRVLDREPPAFLERNPNVSFRSCEVTSKADCLAGIEGVDAVFHRVGLMGNMASMRAPLEYYDVNLRGTLNVLDACVEHKVRRFVFDSTEAVYGRNIEGPLREEDLAEPSSIYGATKLACEAAVKMYDDKHGLSTLIFRYSRTRASDKPDVVSILAKKIINGDPITLYDGGEPTIDFVELDDVIKANELALISPLRREVVNISSGDGVSFKELLSAIEKEVGHRAASVGFQQLAAQPPTSEHQFGSRSFFMSIEKARQRLGWSPSWTVAQSVAKTVAILKGQGT